MTSVEGIQFDVRAVKQQADIVKVIEGYIRLRKAGAQNYSGLCPFHEEKSPSFSVHEVRQFYHCFGCQASGDVFSFVGKIENVSFPEAVRIVAQKSGIAPAGGETLGNEWVVDGLIRKRDKGIISGEPWAGKGIFALDLLFSLSLGTNWLGRDVPRRLRTAYISRQDSPALTGMRLHSFSHGKGISLNGLSEYFWCNTVEQSERFHIDVQADLEEVARALKQHGIEFCIIDPLHAVHSKNECSVTDMASVMGKLDELAELSGAQIFVVHQLGRTDDLCALDPVEQWADVNFRLKRDAEDESIRTATLKTKAPSDWRQTGHRFRFESHAGMQLKPLSEEQQG